MTRSGLIERLAAANPHLRARDLERIVGTVFERIASALARGDRVELRGFGARVAVPGKVAPRFKVGKELHQRLNSVT